MLSQLLWLNKFYLILAIGTQRLNSNCVIKDRLQRRLYVSVLVTVGIKIYPIGYGET